MEFFGSVAGRLAAVGRELLVQALAVYATLLKVMLPALLVVKALDMAGATGWLAVLLSPSMQLVGLPDAMGLVWATAMLTNLYTAIAVYAGFAAQEPLTVAQATVLGTMMLVSHSLPVEGAVARASGVGWRATLLSAAALLMVLGTLVYDQIAQWRLGAYQRDHLHTRSLEPAADAASGGRITGQSGFPRQGQRQSPGGAGGATRNRGHGPETARGLGHHAGGDR